MADLPIVIMFCSVHFGSFICTFEIACCRGINPAFPIWLSLFFYFAYIAFTMYWVLLATPMEHRLRSVTEWVIFVWFMELLELDTDKCK